MEDRSHFEQLDAADPLGRQGEQFERPPGIVYLDGNSLGPLPTGVAATVERTIKEEWGRDLITSWNRNGWWDLALRTGDRIAPLIGVEPGCVVAGDTTTVALYRTALAAMAMRPDRSVILTDSGNFPTDLYALGSAAAHGNASLLVVEPEEIPARIGDDVAVVALTHVDYRLGRRHDMDAIDRAADAAGALTLWDLSHSVGALDLDLTAAAFAVGCGYKYLNGGPGAPAFTYVRPDLIAVAANGIAGWWGHADPFAMSARFRPAPGIQRMQVGTQPILSMVSLHSALEVFEGVSSADLDRKSRGLTSAFIELCRVRVPEVEIVGPSDPEQRGSHVSVAHPRAEAVAAGLRSVGVVGDRRPPDLIRFGFSPLYQRYTDVWDAVAGLRSVLDGSLPEPTSEGPVT